MTVAKPLPVRRTVLILIALAGLWAAWHLKLDPRPGAIAPAGGGLSRLTNFASAAFLPAITYESPNVPPGTQPLLMKVFIAAVQTIGFAAAAISISLGLGMTLAFLATSALWRDSAPSRKSLPFRFLSPAFSAITRVIIALMRSVHELLWAVLFLAAMGLTNLTAVIAIAIPYTGTFAKIFAEMIEEAPQNAAGALHAAGASPGQTYWFGLVPRVLPDLASYALYRFECALRSSAVLGFFGIPTLGYYLRLSFENSHDREVWTYLFALILIVALTDAWSGAVRRRLAA